jgi:hypothetical protein
MPSRRADDGIFLLRQHRPDLESTAGEWRITFAMIGEIVRYLFGVAKIVQAGVRELRRSPAGTGGKIVNDLQRCQRGVPHRRRTGVRDVPEIGHRILRVNDDKYD